MKEIKNLRATDGSPFYFGIAAGVLMLLSTVLSINLTQAYMDSLVSANGLPEAMKYSGVISSVISFIVDPGIFLILLIAGKNKPKRGSTFCVVWIVIGAISIISSVVSIVTSAQNPAMKQLLAIAETVMPGGMNIVYGLSVLGGACMIVCCVLLLKRLRQPVPEETSVPDQQDL